MENKLLAVMEKLMKAKADALKETSRCMVPPGASFDIAAPIDETKDSETVQEMKRRFLFYAEGYNQAIADIRYLLVKEFLSKQK